MNKQLAVSPAFKATRAAIDKIKKNISKLTESEKATVELMLDREAKKNLAISLRDAREGNLISLNKARKELL